MNPHNSNIHHYSVFVRKLIGSYIVYPQTVTYKMAKLYYDGRDVYISTYMTPRLPKRVQKRNHNMNINMNVNINVNIRMADLE